MSELRTIAEFLYFLSGVALAVIAVFGLQQIKILKRDIKVRNDRASKEKALEFVQKYEDFIGLHNAFFRDCVEKKFGMYEGPIGDFSWESIKPAERPNAINRIMLNTSLGAMNKLNLVAACFMSGVADEQLGFSIIGKGFCANVANIYDLLSFARGEKKSVSFQPIVDLYQLWSPRLSKAQLLQAREDIETQLAATVERSIRAIGTE
jgi:hypothetical protein